MTSRPDLARAPRRVAPRKLTRGILHMISVPVLMLAAPLLRVIERRRHRRALAPARLVESWLPAAQGGPAAGSMRSQIELAVTVEPRADLASAGLGLVYAVSVRPDFGRRHYAAVAAMLQMVPGAKVLDLRAARMISGDLFAAIASGWHIPTRTVPRLAIVMTFDHWAVFRDQARADFVKLHARGVAAEVFYEQQARTTELITWFGRGAVTHDVATVVRALRTRWRPTPVWPLVLDALSELLRAHAPPDAAPALFADAAHVALSCGGPDKATTFAREALVYMPDGPSVTRCKALRALGVALIAQGEPAVGLHHLDQAIAIAVAIGATAEAASALGYVGRAALDRGDSAAAEASLRRAVDWLSPIAQPELAATLHHYLAVALLAQGCEDAAHHATIALTLRPDPLSAGAREDRELLRRIREHRPVLS